MLYRTVQTHLATWLALHDDGEGATAPAAVEREFRRYLDCGYDFLIAYSFKCRGVCPSCTTRRMVETAAQTNQWGQTRMALT